MGFLASTIETEAYRVIDQATPYHTGIDATHGNYQSVTGLPYFVNPSGTDIPLWSGSTSPLTTKGDVLTYSSVPVRLGIGANNSVFVADSAQTTGNKWTTALTGLTLDNTVIGGTTPAAGTFTALTVTGGNNPSQTWKDGSGNIVASISTLGHLALGQATAPSTTTSLDVTETFASPGAQVIGLGAFITTTYGSASSQNVFGFRSRIDINQTGGNVNGGTQAAIRGIANAIGSANTVTQIAGMNFVVQNTGAGTLASGLGSLVQAAVNSGGGGLTTFIAYKSETQTAATNNIYLLLGTTAPSGNWAIHATTTSDSALAGSLIVGSTTASSTKFTAVTTDTGTNAVVNVTTIAHNSSNTTAAGFGTGILMAGRRSTTNDTTMGRIRWLFTDVTSSWLTKSVWSAQDSNGERDVIYIAASGSAPMLSFFSVTTPIVQPTTAIAAATFVANTSGIVNDTATFDGYTIGQMAKIIRNLGLAA